MHSFFYTLRSFDSQLHHFISIYGKQIYVLLALIIFAKTAYIFLTFLPGDATLFASGTIASIGYLDIRFLLIIFIFSTLAGDIHNYFLGRIFIHASKKSKKIPISKLMPNRSIHKANIFLTKYGKASILFSRFIPLLSATIPFISGITNYKFNQFFKYNSIGACIWTFFWVLLGYEFGQVAWVSEHLSLLFAVITLITLLPVIGAFIIKIVKNSTSKLSS